MRVRRSCAKRSYAHTFMAHALTRMHGVFVWAARSILRARTRYALRCMQCLWTALGNRRHIRGCVRSCLLVHGAVTTRVT